MTYPRFPQPILRHSSGQKFYLEVSNAGALTAKAMTDGEAWGAPRLTLVNAVRTLAYRLSLSWGDTPLEDHAPNTGTGAWVRRLGLAATVRVSQNKVEGNATTGASFYRFSGTPPSADYEVEADLIQVGPLGAPGILGRIRETGLIQGYLAHFDKFLEADPGTWRLLSVVNGVSTELGTYVGDSAFGQTRNVRLSMIGTAIKVYIDDVERISATDAGVTDAGFAGLMVAGTSFINNFQAGDFLVDAFDVTPEVVSTEVDPEYGTAGEISVWSPNGREWSIYIDSDGDPAVRSSGSDWPRIVSPVLKDANNIPWHLRVTAGGVLSVESDNVPQALQSLILLSQDGTAAYRVTISTDGILSVDTAALSEAIYYDAEVVSSDGVRWSIQVDQSGILSVNSVLADAEGERDQWPLVLAKDGTLYCADTRFRAPISARRKR